MKKNNKLSLVVSNVTPKVFSLLAAIIIFLVVQYFQMVDRRVVIPLQVKLPESSVVVPESLVPKSIEIVISGTDKLVYLVEPDKIVAIADFTDITEVGIARVPVTLLYDQDVFDSAELVVTATKPIVRILFKEP
ncbi:MAG: hypothetical protein GX903_00725 [Spirochaetales bacterium]|nr:hypothetical protein [Spirochaetales bacterium]